MGGIPNFIKFPKTINSKRWVEYLGRKLSKEERSVIDRTKVEFVLNSSLSDLNNNITRENLEVSLLTKLDGNCMFESLVYHNIGNSIKELRGSLSYLMWSFQDYTYLDNKMTFKDQFKFSKCDEIEYVKVMSENKFYRYSYNIMCRDINNLGSWKRLPAEIILRALCIFFNLRIIIYHTNNNWSTDINIYSDKTEDDISRLPKLNKIYLGQLGESHYVPLDFKKDNSESLHYKDAYKEFIKWAYKVERMTIEKYRLHLEETDDNSAESVNNLDVTNDKE